MTWKGVLITGIIKKKKKKSSPQRCPSPTQVQLKLTNRLPGLFLNGNKTYQNVFFDTGNAPRVPNVEWSS